MLEALRVGIFGGTFNPPHIGHLICAQEAHWQVELDKVVVMPLREAPHKRIEPDPGAEVRYELCRLAVEGDERFEVSRLEVEREGPSYSVDTLRELRERSPADELLLVLGGDEAESLPAWREPEEVLRLAELAVAERDVKRERIREALAGLAGAERAHFFSMPQIDVSSTLVRARVAVGRPIRYLVPPAVEDHIERTGLYRTEVEA